MKDRDIYKKILVFILPRIPCYIVAFLAAILVLALIGVPAYKAGASYFVLVLISVLAILVFYFVSAFMRLPYQSAAVSLIVKACNGQQISNHPFKEGMKDVKDRFKVYTPFGLVISAFKYVKNKDKSEENKNEIINDAKSFVVFMLANSVFYISTCFLVEVMYFRDKSYTRCIYETIQTIRKNFKTFIKKSLSIFFFYVVIPVMTFMVGFIVIGTLVSNNVNINNFIDLMAESFEIELDIESISYFLLGLVFTFITYIFINPMGTIKVARFFTGLIKETEFDYTTYEKIGKRTDRFKIIKRLKQASKRVNNEE